RGFRRPHHRKGVGVAAVSALDPRLNAYRDDLADARLQGKVEAVRFTEGSPARVGAAVADMRGAPRPDSGVNSQLVRGQDVRVFDKTACGASLPAPIGDLACYVGPGALGPPAARQPHIVAAPRGVRYPALYLRLSVSGRLSMGSLFAAPAHAETRGTRYAL